MILQSRGLMWRFTLIILHTYLDGKEIQILEYITIFYCTCIIFS